jgi:hypothetical protein
MRSRVYNGLNGVLKKLSYEDDRLELLLSFASLREKAMLKKMFLMVLNMNGMNQNLTRSLLSRLSAKVYIKKDPAKYTRKPRIIQNIEVLYINNTLGLFICSNK